MSTPSISHPASRSSRLPDEIPITQMEAEQIYRECAADEQRRAAADREAEQLDRERWAAEARGRPGWRSIPVAEFRSRLIEMQGRQPVEHRRAPRRRARRAPRRSPSRSATRRAATDGDDGPGSDAEPPLAVARIGLTPLIVSDSPDAEDVLRAVLGMTSRQLREFVVERGIPHGRRSPRGKHLYVLAADVVRALGLAEPTSSAPVQSAPNGSEDEIVARAARPKTPASSRNIARVTESRGGGRVTPLAPHAARWKGGS